MIRAKAETRGWGETLNAQVVSCDSPSTHALGHLCFIRLPWLSAAHRRFVAARRTEKRLQVVGKGANPLPELKHDVIKAKRWQADAATPRLSPKKVVTI
jgi:hypothetical protein